MSDYPHSELQKYDFMTNLVRHHIAAIEGFFSDYLAETHILGESLAQCLAQGGKLLVCGNGGSACDAMHVAGEFVGRFTKDRRAFPAIALSADSGMLTAIGNDYGFENVFARQVAAYGQKGDFLIALSTSGTSSNIVAALAEGKRRGLTTILLTGTRGAGQQHSADKLFVVPSIETARIQEVHMTFLHALTEIAEKALAQQGAL